MVHFFSLFVRHSVARHVVPLGGTYLLSAARLIVRAMFECAVTDNRRLFGWALHKEI